MKSVKRVSVAAGLAVVALSQVMTPAVMAWGPERPTYTMDNPAHSATFNSIIDNAAVQDERDFVRIVEKGTGNDYVSDLTIEAGKEYEVLIYFHNDASSTFNDAAHDYVGVAQETKVSSMFPSEMSAGDVDYVFGRITSPTATPEAVWDEAYIRAKEDITLHYVSGSAKILNRWQANGTVLSQSLFTNEGTPIGMNALNGVVPGCDIFSGQVVYTIQTQAVVKETPDDPEPKPEDKDPEPETPTPKPEETPKELPYTGPAEVALAVIVVVAIVAGFVYWQKTHKAVRRVTKKARGRK